MKAINRRDFLKYGLGGSASVVIGSRLPWLSSGAAAAPATQLLEVTITDAMKEMITHNAINEALCYFWIYTMTADGVPIDPEYPGPTVVATQGDTISIRVTNELDEPHALFIPGMFDSGSIDPGDTFEGDFSATQVGAFLYYDNLNEPVNRVMGLHGALIVMPSAPIGAHKFTPYANPTQAVQKLYDDFGSSEHFPGLAWEEGDDTPWVFDPDDVNCPPFRQYVWLAHEASPNLFAEVGSLGEGEIYNAQDFMQAFLRDPFSPTGDNRIPQYFMMNGMSGAFSHMAPGITPIGRVGEPVVVHILNAGLWMHSMHLHANHFYVTSINGVVQENPLWVDVYNIHPMDRTDYTVPFMRPPDVGTETAIGLPGTPLLSERGTPVWPPVEELDTFIPAPGEITATDINGNTIDLEQRMSPLCYPMHDHSEPSQTSQGGNYNCGLISGMYITGDRNTPGHMDFPMEEDFLVMYHNVRGVSGTNMAAGLHRHEPAPLASAGALAKRGGAAGSEPVGSQEAIPELKHRQQA